jgi:hypothetical protein
MNPSRSIAIAIAIAVAAVGLAAALPAQAHKASDAYMAFQVVGGDVDARIDIALRDLDRDLDLDTDADDQLSWKEVRTRWADIAALARNDIRLSADGARCAPEPATTPVTAANAPALTEHSDGHYAVLRMHWHCGTPVHQLSVDYELFARSDPTHRGIVRVGRPTRRAADAASASGPVGAADETPTQLAVLSPGNGWHRFRLPRPSASAVPSTRASAVASASVPGSESAATAGAARVIDAGRQMPRRAAPGRTADIAAAGIGHAVDADVDLSGSDAASSSFFGFVREGIHHILIGYDHILFLLSLLLPAVWIRSRATDPRTGLPRARWLPAADLRFASTNVLKVVTAFTVAHSITLALSVFDIVDPPSRWVESVIAASVVLAALNNIWPLVSEARWKLTFVFGLVHGFGFASALKDAGLAHGALAGPLVGFNVGVEIGQLCIVAVVLPIAWSLRGTRTYRGAFAGGSLAIAMVAGLWLVQRAFDLSLIAG